MLARRVKRRCAATNSVLSLADVIGHGRRLETHE